MQNASGPTTAGTTANQSGTNAPVADFSVFGITAEAIGGTRIINRQAQANAWMEAARRNGHTGILGALYADAHHANGQIALVRQAGQESIMLVADTKLDAKFTIIRARPIDETDAALLFTAHQAARVTAAVAIFADPSTQAGQWAKMVGILTVNTVCVMGLPPQGSKLIEFIDDRWLIAHVRVGQLDLLLTVDSPKHPTSTEPTTIRATELTDLSILEHLVPTDKALAEAYAEAQYFEPPNAHLDRALNTARTLGYAVEPGPKVKPVTSPGDGILLGSLVIGGVETLVFQESTRPFNGNCIIHLRRLTDADRDLLSAPAGITS
jgi:hypothetical protein